MYVLRLYLDLDAIDGFINQLRQRTGAWRTGEAHEAPLRLPSAESGPADAVPETVWRLVDLGRMFQKRKLILNLKVRKSNESRIFSTISSDIKIIKNHKRFLV